VVQVDPDTVKKSSDISDSQISGYRYSTVLYRYTCAPRISTAQGLQAFALRCRRLCSPPRFFATRAMSVLARNQLPALSVASPLMVSTTNREPANYVLRMLAAGSLLAALVQPEAAECGGTKRKKGTVVKEFYEVDCMKARRIVKGGAIEYLIHWKGYEDKDDTWEPLSDKPFWHGAGSLGL